MKFYIDCRYVRERPSGIGRYVHALIQRVPNLAPEDRFHIWVSPRAQRPLTRFSNVAETVVGAPANSLRTLLGHGSLADLDGADLFHAPFNILGLGVRCPVVVTVHDLLWLDNPRACSPTARFIPFESLFYRVGILRALRRASRIIAISEATAADIIRRDPSLKSRIRVIHHGIEDFFRPPSDPEAARRRASALIGHEGPYFLVVGQNAPYKNHESILEAFVAAGLGKDFRLVMVQRLFPGGGLLKRARELGVEDQIVWSDVLDGLDLVALYQGAVALVQFSRYEGFAMPVLESMACGTPVIISEIPALLEVAGGAALAVPLARDSLAAALKRIAREPSLRQELGLRGLERSRRFSWDDSARLHLEVYREAAREGLPREGTRA